MNTSVIMQLFIICMPPLSLLYAINGFCSNPRKWRKYIIYFVYFIFILICAFSLAEGKNKDLIRYYQMEHIAAQMPLVNVLEYPYKNLYVVNFLFWLFGNFGIPQMLPAFSISIVMFVVIYITCDLAEKYNALSWIKWIILYQLMILPFMFVMEVVRSSMAFFMAIFFAYLEIIQQKKSIWIYIGYIICTLIHPMAFIFLIFRIVASLPHIVGKMMIFLLIGLDSIIRFAHDRLLQLFTNGGLVSLIITKAYRYMVSMDSEYGKYAAISKFFIVNKFVICTEAVIMVILVYYLICKPIVHERRYISFLLFFNMINLLALSLSTFFTPIYSRYTSAGYACIGALIIPFIKGYNRMNPIVQLLFLALCGMAIPAFALQLYWTETYTDSFLSWGGELLTTNLFTVLYQVMVNLKLLS